MLLIWLGAAPNKSRVGHSAGSEDVILQGRRGFWFGQSVPKPLVTRRLRIVLALNAIVGLCQYFIIV
jgi:hypothetical protein